MKANKFNWSFVLLYASIVTVLACLFISLGYSLNFGGIDFTNRVVGSRVMMETDYNPYTFKWDETKDIRYLDPSDWDSTKVKVNRCTATPFFLFLFYPIAVLPYNLARIIWFVLGWFIIITTIRINLGNYFKDSLLWAISLLFVGLFPAFMVHLEHGQLYLLIALVISLQLRALQQEKIILCSLYFTISFLIHPILLIFLLPLMFFNFKSFIRIAMYSLIFLIIFLLFMNFMGVEVEQWSFYQKAMQQHESVHFLFNRTTLKKGFNSTFVNSELLMRMKTVLHSLDRSIKGIFYNAFNIKLYSKVLISVYILIICFPYIIIKLKHSKQKNKKLMKWEFLGLYYILCYFIPAPRYLYHEVILIVPFTLFLKSNLFLRIKNSFVQ